MKILMALASLDIGGAETHVTELSKELSRRGHEIVVVSGGGVFEEELERFGIKHYLVPVKRRNYMDIIKAMSQIEKIIKAEKPDIVHSHARIPSFIIGEIHRKMKRSFVYVTTVHGEFDTSFVVRKLSRWGEKSLAVSRDLMEYLYRNYNVSKKNIYMGINGIDEGKFSPDVSGGEIIKEFSLNPNAKRLVYVSRIEEDVCLPALCILECMEKLDKKFPGIEFVIVGDGEYMNKMSEIADRVNTSLKRRAVILTGARVDINKIHAAADVCVGVSRAILEPMCMAKPCIIAGQMGYMGILNKENLPIAIENNFTCRGCDATGADKLFEDITRLFSEDEKIVKEIADFGRNAVLKHYSIDKMASDNEAMYIDAVRDHTPNTVMVGYYGYGNRGDDALLYAIIDDMRNRCPDFCPVVLSKNPEETALSYGVESINRFNVFKVRKAMKNARMLMAGGGSLIQDVTSTRSLMYYLSCLSMAKRMGLSVMLYANGMGPIRKEKNRRKSAKVLDEIDVITLRDNASAVYLEKMGVTKPAISVTGDPAFSLDKCDLGSADEILSSMGIEGKILALSVRSVEDGEDFAENFASFADKICSDFGFTPVFIPMQYAKDKKVSLDVMEKMNTKAYFIDENLDIETIMGIVKRSEAVVAVRLHMLVFGAVMGTPVLGINYDPKVKSNIEEMGIGQCLEVDELSADAGWQKASEFFNALDETRAQIPKKLTMRIKKAKENASIASELLTFREGK